MAKKFVRGITDVKTINNQDFDTNNVNDLLSDGQYNYIHRKKGKTEEYHNLTDNIKTISSDNTELLSVTNNNKTTNTATLHPKHDKQKEQVLESTRDTIAIHHGTNGTAEKTTVDTNPQKVLEHENLQTTYGISKTTTGNTTKLGVEYTKVDDGFDLNNLLNGRVRGRFINSPKDNELFFVTAYSNGNDTVQEGVQLFTPEIVKYIRRKTSTTSGQWTTWQEQLADKATIDALLAQKQDKLIAGDGITIQGNTISASGGRGETSFTNRYEYERGKLSVTEHIFEFVDYTLTTFTFQLSPLTSEVVIEGELVQKIEAFIPDGSSISNGAVTITNDGTTIKATNSKSTENVYQQGTFTFYEETGGGGDV